jgi:hypothetical protein
MTDRSWYIVVDGKQAGPYPESQFLEFIANGQIDRNALVWTEGMTAWQRAGYVPGLFPPAPAAAPPPPVAAAPMIDRASARGVAIQPSALAVQSQTAVDSGNRLQAEFSALGLFGRSLLYSIGMTLIVTAPWAATSYYRWMIARIRVPGRPDLAFEGKAGDIWWAFVLIPLSTLVPFVGIFLSIYFSLFAFRWAVRNVSSQGRLLPLTFNGSYWGYLGYQILLGLSFITIIGWAWVAAAWARWFCRNIAGSSRPITFTGSGLEILWRSIVAYLCCIFIIPIPWIMRWYARWFISQIAVG